VSPSGAVEPAGERLQVTEAKMVASRIADVLALW
jgi:hypothetical protein